MLDLTQLQAASQRLNQNFQALSEAFKLQSKLLSLNQLEQQLTPILWKQNFKQASSLNSQIAASRKQLQAFSDLKSEISQFQALLQAEGDKPDLKLFNDWQQTLNQTLDQLNLEISFRGEHDACEILLTILAGAGGVDAQDWVEMLYRMYQRFARSRQARVELVYLHPGQTAGLKSVSLFIKQAPFLYGWLSGEQGVHRLVRQSPFNAANLRQTSFARVEVLPLIPITKTLEIREADLRWDFFRASSAGGQSVNKTNSAVRLTHLPTKLSVSIQNERSQKQNRDLALKILNLRLQVLSQAQQQTKLQDLQVKTENQWGNQIRNYILHPYKLVKDLRSQYSSSDVDKVLDGELDPLLKAYLKQKLKN